jgi:hypothetical protein
MPTKNTSHSVIDLPRFIQATRDSGYKNTTSAVAELVDNSIQAGATSILVEVFERDGSDEHPIVMRVADNGTGMTAAALREALRFGGSSRFGAREGLGRFGMGLPNASLSQSRRVVVYTWSGRSGVMRSYLDVGEIAAGKMTEVPAPRKAKLPRIGEQLGSPSGTVVEWEECDRLDNRRTSTLTRKLQSALGRIFRHFIWNGVAIAINDEKVEGLDPLYLHPASPLVGATRYGEDLEFAVRTAPTERRTGKVRVRFSELPVEKWADLPVAEKRARGIANGAGISVVRAGREIDYGWFFMGGKRRENYDDWWRCEIQFDPVLDEVFGITHTKQQIRPQEHLLEAISGDLEEIGKALNARVRHRHSSLKASGQTAPVELELARHSKRLPAIPRRREPDRDDATLRQLEAKHSSLHPRAMGAEDVEFRLVEDDQPDAAFFRTLVDKSRVVVVVNSRHQFYKKFYRRIVKGEAIAPEELATLFHALLLSAGRAEAMASRRGEIESIAAFRDSWGHALGLLLHG